MVSTIEQRPAGRSSIVILSLVYRPIKQRNPDGKTPSGKQRLRSMSPQPDLRTSKMRVNDDEYSKACKGLEEIIADEDRRSRLKGRRLRHFHRHWDAVDHLALHRLGCAGTYI